MPKKLTKEQVIIIYRSFKTPKQLAKEFNVNEATIRAITNGITWRHVTNNIHE
jgi:hypothetical protein